MENLQADTSFVTSEPRPSIDETVNLYTEYERRWLDAGLRDEITKDDESANKGRFTAPWLRESAKDYFSRLLPAGF